MVALAASKIWRVAYVTGQDSGHGIGEGEMRDMLDVYLSLCFSHERSLSI